MNLSELFTIDNMIEAYYSCRQAAPWKTEVQKFGLNLVGNCIALQNEILTEKKIYGCLDLLFLIL